MTYLYYAPTEIIELKSKKLDLGEISAVDFYLKTPGTPKEGYVKELYDVILFQLIIKAGFDIEKDPLDISSTEQQRLELLAERLTVHFLKRKLDRIKKPEQLAFKSGSEILDPHHHLNSIYVKDNPHLLNLLPDFNAIFEALRGIAVNREREDELREQQGILTDAQFIGNPPTRGYHSLTHPPQRKMNPTVGYVRGPNSNSLLKGGSMGVYARQNNNVCRCCDMCGPETKDTWKDLVNYLDHTIRHKAEIIRVHIGETHIPEHGKSNVDLLFRLLEAKRTQGEIVNQIIRLGHGTHMGIQSMQDSARYGYYVEACLSSNKETGIITKRKEYPLGLMLLLDVKVMLGTDGGDVYYTDLKTEYAHAKRVISHFLGKIEKESDEIIKLPNGDQLQYKYVKGLFADVPQAAMWDDTQLISYKDLKLIEAICKRVIVKCGVQH